DKALTFVATRGAADGRNEMEHRRGASPVDSPPPDHCADGGRRPEPGSGGARTIAPSACRQRVLTIPAWSVPGNEAPAPGPSDRVRPPVRPGGTAWGVSYDVA